MTMHRKYSAILAGIILTVASILAVASAWNDSLIVDEIPHVGAGYSYVRMFDMRLNPEHPPLAKALAALPLRFMTLDESVFETSQWQIDVNGQWNFGRRLIFDSGNNAILITHLVKIPMLSFFVIAGIFVFLWTKKRYGSKAALLALALYAFCPTVLAHARFVTTDVPALFGIIVSSYCFIAYLKDPTVKRFWFAVLALGLALLCKFSTVLLIPYFIILAVVWMFSTGRNESNQKQQFLLFGKSLLIILFSFVFVIWPFYFILSFNYPVDVQLNATQKLLAPNPHQNYARVVVWMADKPVLRSLAVYGTGLLMVVHRSEGGNQVYFNGVVEEKTAGPKYFPFVYFIKEPLAWWALVATAFIFFLYSLISTKKNRRINIPSLIKDHFDELAMILWLGIYWYTSIRSTLNIGVRHLLPIYPFTIILVSGQLSLLYHAIKRRSTSFNVRLLAYEIFLFLMLGWFAFENLSVFPYYLSYFNETVGGPKGAYRYVVDSNLDWGQDLKRLATWVDEHHIASIELDYFGWSNPSYYLRDKFLWLTAKKFKGAEDFKARNTSNGWIAVSATFIMNNFDTNYAWLYARKPVTVIGNSIFVYHIE